MSRVSQTSLLLPAAVAVAGLLASIPYIVQLRRRLESCEKKLSAAEQSLDEAAESTAKTEALATEALKDLASEVAALSSEPAPAPVPTEPLMTEVAHVASCYSHICVTPRNSFLVPKARSEIRFAKTIPAEALDGLEENSHCWVLFQFHRNNNGHKLASGKTFRAKVRVPRNNAVQGDGKTGRKVGCFATRTPHRPNNLGLTLARIKHVDLSRRTVVLSGSDLLDGTPVYDVKPYVPCYDSPAVLDPETPLKAAGFSDYTTFTRRKVTFSAEASAAWGEIGGRLRLFAGEAGEALEALEDTLAVDLSRGVSGVDPPRPYELEFDGVVVEYRVFGEGCDTEVLRVRSK